MHSYFDWRFLFVIAIGSLAILCFFMVMFGMEDKDDDDE